MFVHNCVCVCGCGCVCVCACVCLQEFDDWVKDTDKHGFVVVSFGAGVKYLSEDIAHKLAGALAQLPQKVIWR